MRKLIGTLSLGFRHPATLYSSIMATAKTGFYLSKEYFQIYIESDMNHLLSYSKQAISMMTLELVVLQIHAPAINLPLSLLNVIAKRKKIW